jgi:hypothetical protein
MGIRIAKFDGEDRWICYASATDACYEPIFLDELSAWLYAHVVTVRHSLVLEHPEYAIGEEVQKFVKLTYGNTDEFAEGDVYLDDVASITAGRIGTFGTTRGDEIMEELERAYFTWRKDQSQVPPQRVEAK